MEATTPAGSVGYRTGSLAAQRPLPAAADAGTVSWVRRGSPGGHIGKFCVSLAYSSAGRTPGYLVDRGGAVRSELFATGLPLRLFPESVGETRSVGRLEKGDTLLLLTDGVTDCGPPEGELFGAEQTLEVLRSLLGARSADIVEGLYRAVRAFENGGPQRDDVTTVVVTCLLGT
jgi:serine phosphatase RsbU (regulator of sigma subunit)